LNVLQTSTRLLMWCGNHAEPTVLWGHDRSHRRHCACRRSSRSAELRRCCLDSVHRSPIDQDGSSATNARHG
jgi:hypothetical protein